LKIICRTHKKNISGHIVKDGKEIHLRSVQDAIQHGIAYVTEDRKRYGLNLIEDIKRNISAVGLGQLAKRGLVNENEEYRVATEFRESLNIKAPNVLTTTGKLSGGNQQKVVLARALASDPRVVVLINPTAGVDVKSKEALLAVVDRVRAEGKAVLIVSDELDDLRLSDRVLVLRAGAVVAEHQAGWSDGDLVADIEGVRER